MVLTASVPAMSVIMSRIVFIRSCCSAVVAVVDVAAVAVAAFVVVVGMCGSTRQRCLPPRAPQPTPPSPPTPQREKNTHVKEDLYAIMIAVARPVLGHGHKTGSNIIWNGRINEKQQHTYE